MPVHAWIWHWEHWVVVVPPRSKNSWPDEIAFCLGIRQHHVRAQMKAAGCVLSRQKCQWEIQKDATPASPSQKLVVSPWTFNSLFLLQCALILVKNMLIAKHIGWCRLAVPEFPFGGLLSNISPCHCLSTSLFTFRFWCEGGLKRSSTFCVPNLSVYSYYRDYFCVVRC